jgi:hypothetical protein
VFAAPWSRNGRPIIPLVLFCGNVFSDQLPSTGHGAGHVENTSSNTFSIVACAYFGRCLVMGLHITVYHLCDGHLGIIDYLALNYRMIIKYFIGYFIHGTSSNLIWSNLVAGGMESTQRKPRDILSMKRQLSLTFFCKSCWSGLDSPSVGCSYSQRGETKRLSVSFAVFVLEW